MRFSEFRSGLVGRYRLPTSGLSDAYPGREGQKERFAAIWRDAPPAGRQGRPTILEILNAEKAAQASTSRLDASGTKENPQNFAGLSKGESRDIAAKAVDMNRESYRQAKAVVDSGNREVIEQMDKGDLSIHAAYKQVGRSASHERPNLRGKTEKGRG